MIKALMALCLCVSMGFLNPATAEASLMTVSEVTNRGSQLSQKMIKRLDEPQVQAELAKHGISATEARMRVAALSDQEIQNLLNSKAAVQAGGDVVISLTAVLLIIIIILLLRR